MAAPLNELIKQYIKNSGYSVYSIALASSINRTLLQHILRGDRTLSRDNFERLLPFLKLSPDEKKELESAFIMQQLGEEACQKDLIIKEMLELFPGNYPVCKARIPIPAVSVTQTLSVNGCINIISIICQLVSADIQEGKTPFFRAVGPFDPSFFTGLYGQFSNPYFHRLHCVHLLPFIKGGKAAPCASLYNLKNFGASFPFAIHSAPMIDFYYYYEAAGTCVLPSGTPFPYYIILSHNIILLSRDFSTACILPETGIGYFQNHMQSLLDSAYPLTETSDSPGIFEGDGMYHENISCSCSINAPELILDNFLTKSAAAYGGFSQSQYDTFVRQGIFPGSFGGTERTFTTDERICILKHMSEYNQHSAHRFVILKPTMFSPHISFISCDNSASFCFKPAKGKKRFCHLKEADLVVSFNEFVKNLPLYQYAYSAEASGSIFETSAKELAQQITALP